MAEDPISDLLGDGPEPVGPSLRSCTACHGVLLQRRKRRRSVDLWIDLLLMAHPDVTPQQARLRVHAAISAIHSVLLYHSPLDADELTVRLGSVAGGILLLPPDELA